jgi:hypothetical protein
MTEPGTLYERILTKLKNTRSVVLILFLVAVVIGASQFLGGLSAITDFLAPQRMDLRVTAFVQPFDLMAEATESPKVFGPTGGDIDDIRGVSEQLAREVASFIQPGRSLEATLELVGSSLRSSHPLHVYLLLLGGAFQQQGPLQKELGADSKVDLLQLFQDEAFVGRDCQCIEAYVRDRSGYFKREHVRVFRTNGGLSFDARSRVSKKTIGFVPRASKVILDRFEGAGASAEVVERSRMALESELRQKLMTLGFLEMSPLTRADLQRKREEIKQLKPGSGKAHLIDQYSVDFIVTGTLLVHTRRQLRGF